jgi:hypothetical protein
MVWMLLNITLDARIKHHNAPPVKSTGYHGTNSIFLVSKNQTSGAISPHSVSIFWIISPPLLMQTDHCCFHAISILLCLEQATFSG